MLIKKSRAFTILELLIVVAIIAILAALLMSAIQTVREKAQRIACANNLRQLYLAFMIYYNDYGQLPHFYYWLFRTSAGISSGDIWPYIQNEAVYLCPRDNLIRLPGYGSEEHFSYAVNFSVGILKTLAKVKSPASALYIIEEGFDSPGNDGYAFCFGFDKPALRHAGGGNHVFCDGHIEWILREDLL